MKTINYDDGISIDYTAARGWIDETGDAESRASESKVTLPAASIAHLEESLMIAAARCVAADASGVEFEFGPKSTIRFTGRMVGAGTDCGWLEVKLRIDRDKFGEPMAIAHMISVLESATRQQPHEVVGRVVAFLTSILDRNVVGARDEHPEWRRNLSERVQASDLQWYLEDAAKPFGAAVVEK